MPTHDEFEQFMREYLALTPTERRLFAKAVVKMVADMKAGKPFRKRLRISALGGYPGIYEMTWDMPDGRATFMYGPEQIPGEPHIIWRRIGGHDIFDHP
ncbi:MAG TPA: hypothetical protein VFU60_13555 [Ktedonobacterales bacterium]|nr:hypothetical protein [Ktedonobacterales bacterium]